MSSWPGSCDVWITNYVDVSNFGYFGGGAGNSTVDRIDYATDTATAAVKGPLSIARYSLAATGNSNFGYYGGGQIPTVVSTVQRIDYANDTANAAAKGPLSVARYYFSATGTSNFGYFGGGLNSGSSANVTIVDRIDYANDTATSI